MLSKKQKVGVGLGVGAAIAAVVAATRVKAAPPTKWSCPYCDKSFPTYEKLVEHVKTEHEGQRIPIPLDWD